MDSGTTLHPDKKRRKRPMRWPLLGFIAVVSLAGTSLFSSESLALKPIIDQADDMGYSNPMIKELSRLFPETRMEYKLEQAEEVRSPLSYQVLTQHQRQGLEERLYRSAYEHLTGAGYQVESLTVSYIGRMKVKVLVSILTKELPYAKVRETLADVRRILEKDVLPQSFVALQLAQLSTFTVLNKKDGRVYEYPVLYQNIELPWFAGDTKKSTIQLKTIEETTVIGKEHEEHEAEIEVDPDADVPASPSPGAAVPSDSSEQTTRNRPSPRPRDPTPRDRSFLMEDFLGAPPIPHASEIHDHDDHGHEH